MIAGYLPGPTTPNLQAGKMASTRETGRKLPSPRRGEGGRAGNLAHGQCGRKPCE
jgi:hypothetical protein